MSDQRGPRVTVALPGGRTVPGRPHAKPQDADRRWWYEVSIQVPATAVRPVDGEDYGQVFAERASTADWVLQALPHGNPKERAVVLHRPECWAAEGRLVAANDAQARAFLREGWATSCDACHPEPGTGHQG